MFEDRQARATTGCTTDITSKSKLVLAPTEIVHDLSDKQTGQTQASGESLIV